METNENKEPEVVIKKKGRPARVKVEATETPQAQPQESKGDVMEKLLAKVEALENKDKENQAKLKMLYDVADKGRVFNYESNATEKKPFRVKLSLYQGGIIVGWRTLRDELVKHPTTGSIVGETQEYELIILDNESKNRKISVLGYPAFSNARYNQRTEAEIVSKSEGYDGSIMYDVKLSDGRVIKLGAQFIN